MSCCQAARPCSKGLLNVCQKIDGVGFTHEEDYCGLLRQRESIGCELEDLS